MKLSKKYFKQKDIWTSSNFESKILPFLKEKEEQPLVLESHDLSKNMWDTEIMKERNIQPLPMNQLVATIIELTKGDTLLKNGYANIFYGQSEEDGRTLVLSVDWDADGGEWYWHCDEVDESGNWDAGPRVWSAATMPLNSSPVPLSLESSDTSALDLAVKIVKEAGYLVIKGEIK